MLARIEGGSADRIMSDIFHELDLVARRGDTRLDLRGKGLEELPEEIGALDTVTELYLSDNALKKLPWSLSLRSCSVSARCDTTRSPPYPTSYGRCKSSNG